MWKNSYENEYFLYLPLTYDVTRVEVTKGDARKEDFENGPTRTYSRTRWNINVRL